MKRMISMLTLVAFAFLAGCADTLFEVPAEALLTCTMPGADAQGNIITHEDGRTKSLVKTGNTLTLQCEGTSVTNLSGRAQRYSGFRCAVTSPGDGTLLFTYDSHGTVSASGASSLTCRAGTDAAALTAAQGQEETFQKSLTHWWGHGRP